MLEPINDDTDLELELTDEDGVSSDSEAESSPSSDSYYYGEFSSDDDDSNEPQARIRDHPEYEASGLFPPRIKGYTVGTSADNVWKHLNAAAKPFFFAYEKISTKKQRGVRVTKLKCCHPSCNHGVQIDTFDDNDSEVCYDRKKLLSNAHYHLPGTDEERESTKLLIRNAEDKRRSLLEFHDYDDVPSSRVCSSKKEVWLRMNKWARDQGFVYVKGHVSGQRKNGKRMLRFECCFDNCEHHINVCHAAKHDRWYVKRPEDIRDHNHKRFVIKPLRDEDDFKVMFEGVPESEYSELYIKHMEIIDTAEDAVAKHLRIRQCPHFLPEEKTFPNRRDFLRYINIFSAAYNNPDGSNATFSWRIRSNHCNPPNPIKAKKAKGKKIIKKQRSNRDKDGKRTEPTKTLALPKRHLASTVYGCEEKAPGGKRCPVWIIGRETASGSWQVRHPRHYRDHNHR